MGRGYVLQAADKWEEASTLFARVAKLSSPETDTGLIAREEYGWCLVQVGKLQEALKELEAVRADLEEFDEYASRKARVWWRIGVCQWRLGGLFHFVTLCVTFALMDSPDRRRAREVVQEFYHIFEEVFELRFRFHFSRDILP